MNAADLAQRADSLREEAALYVADPRAMYTTLYAAFDHFNETLFGGKLPPVVLVLHRKRNAHGYFWNGMWKDGAKNAAEVSEIALNPESMGRTAEAVLSTLAHEMVHHEQHAFGKPGKVGHNKEWAEWMDRIGLTPTSTGAEGGKRTGRNVTHMIVADGPYAKACADFLTKHAEARHLLSSRPAAAVRKQDKSKVKHTCPDCGLNVWGKEGLNVVCGDCDQPLVPSNYL